MKLIAALFASLLSAFPLAQALGREGERPPLPDGTVPMTSDSQGPTKTALPEQAAGPMRTEERPGSPESEKAERIK